MTIRRRKPIRDLTIREYCLYRAICIELEDLEQSILYDGTVKLDLEARAMAMRDRRLLIEWLRELYFPPSSDFADTGLTEEIEEQLLTGALY
jgi:hypothetical protein